jgi:hypothetical protein
VYTYYLVYNHSSMQRFTANCGARGGSLLLDLDHSCLDSLKSELFCNRLGDKDLGSIWVNECWKRIVFFATGLFLDVYLQYEVQWQWWDCVGVLFVWWGQAQCHRDECHWAFSYLYGFTFDTVVAEPYIGSVSWSWTQWLNYLHNLYVPGYQNVWLDCALLLSPCSWLHWPWL